MRTGIFFHCAFSSVILLLLFSGCAVNRTMSYTELGTKVDYKITKSLAISFHDRRQEVVSGSEKPTFCGHVKSTGQIPYNIQTKSLQPVAQEFTESVVKSLAGQGVDVKAIISNYNMLPDSVISLLNNAKQQRSVYFKIDKWKSEATPGMVKILYEVTYDFDCMIFDSDGKLLYDKRLTNFKSMEKGSVVNMKEMQEFSDQAFRDAVLGFLNSNEVMAVLQK